MEATTISPFRARWYRMVGEQVHRMALAEGAILCHIGDKSVFRSRDKRTGVWSSECLSNELKAEIRRSREALAFYAAERREDMAKRAAAWAASRRHGGVDTGSEGVPPGVGSSTPKSSLTANGEAVCGN